LGLFSKFFGSSSAGGKKLTRVNLKSRFKLHNPVGSGSMSKVWRATDMKAGREVCLKILDKPKTDALKKRFVGLKRPDEGEVAIALDHPNIVRTYEWGLSTKGEEFLVMEFVNGVGMNLLVETRAAQLVGNELPLLIQAAEGLDYFHKKGFIHRDICPRNMMVTHEGVLKVIDFGLAVPNTAEFRKPGNRTGTANYMAPELIRRAPTDIRIDIFSFGVTAYETFTGVLPWESAESMQAMLQHLNSPPRDPREINPNVPDAVVPVLLKALARNANERYQNFRELIEDMQQLENNRPRTKRKK
jgi:serine/threonine protein kinase